MNAVPRCFPGETLVCIGSGPSLTRTDVEYCRGRARVLAIKETIRYAPWADVFYACDRRFFEHHEDELVTFAGLKFTLDHMGQQWATTLRQGESTGLSVDPTTLATGWNSGYQAINLAVLLGAAKIVLLGYDMQERNGVRRFFGEHQWGNRGLNFALFLSAFPTLVQPLKQAGVTVINATIGSALATFPHQPLTEALA